MSERDTQPTQRICISSRTKTTVPSRYTHCMRYIRPDALRREFHFGTYHSQDNEHTWHSLKVISEDQFKRLAEASALINDIATPTSFRALEKNWRNLELSLSTMQRIKPASERPRSYAPTPEQLRDRVTFVLANYLNSCRLYVDNITNHYSHDSRGAQFKKLLSDVYDSNSSYRIAYHLRNAYIHTSSIPISIVREAVGDHDASTKIQLNSEKLLNCGFNWKAKVRHDIQELPGDIDVFEILDESFKCHVHIEQERNIIAARYAHETAIPEITSVAPEQDLPGIEGYCCWSMPQTEFGIIIANIGDISFFPARTWIDSLRNKVGNIDSSRKDSPSVDPQTASDPISSDIKITRSALDLMETWLNYGSSATDYLTNQILTDGIESAKEAIQGLVNLAAVSLSEVEQTLGILVSESLSHYRDQLNES